MPVFPTMNQKHDLFHPHGTSVELYGVDGTWKRSDDCPSDNCLKMLIKRSDCAVDDLTAASGNDLVQQNCFPSEFVSRNIPQTDPITVTVTVPKIVHQTVPSVILRNKSLDELGIKQMLQEGCRFRKRYTTNRKQETNMLKVWSRLLDEFLEEKRVGIGK